MHTSLDAIKASCCLVEDSNCLVVDSSCLFVDSSCLVAEPQALYFALISHLQRGDYTATLRVVLCAYPNLCNSYSLFCDHRLMGTLFRTH